MIEVQHLTKKYGNFTAVNDISFTMEKGKVYGFLGPNGAGKSTTMNMITGCLAATSGTVVINGHDIYEEPLEAKECIGYLPELPPLYTDMTPEEYLFFVAEAKGLDDAHLDKSVDAVIRRTGLTGVRDRLIKNLSKGYRQRVGIAQAILGDPEIIILDEPTVGLDPLQIIEIRDLIKSLANNHTVILSSHILSEISAVCSYIIIISHGKIVASDTLENITASTSGQRIVTMEVRSGMIDVEDALKELQGTLHTAVTYGQGGCVRVTVEMPAKVDLREDLFRLFAAHNLPIIDIRTNDVSLEDVFLRLTADDAVVVEAPEEEPEQPAEEAEEAQETEEAETESDTPAEDSPYYEPEKPKKEQKSEDYTPLFGKKD